MNNLPILPYPAELASRFGIPPELASLIALTVAGAAAGQSAQIDTGLGPEPQTANLFLALADTPGSNLQLLTDHLLQPLRDIQSALFNEESSLNHRLINREVQVLETERLRMLCQPDTPAPDKLSALVAKINRLQVLVRPIIMVPSSGPKQLLQALSRSFDHTVLVVSDGVAPMSWLSEKTSLTSTLGRSLLSAGWHRGSEVEGYLQSRKHTSPASGRICISVLQVCDREPLTGLLVNPDTWRFSPIFHTLFIDSKCAPTPLTEAVFPPLQYADAWKTRIQELFTLRRSGQTVVYRPTDEGKAVLFRYQNEVLDLIPRLPERHKRIAETWPSQAWRLALALHLFGPSPTLSVEAQTVEGALGLARWATGEQLAWTREIERKQQANVQNTACEIMLRKIAQEGQITQQKLFRKYRKQAQSIHVPVLNLLIREGEVHESPEGLLSVTGTKGDDFLGTVINKAGLQDCKTATA